MSDTPADPPPPPDQSYEMMVSGIRDYAIFMIDPGGHVSSWNSGAERFTGYRAEEIIGRHLADFYTEDDRAAGLPQHALDTALRDGKYENEGWRVRQDGSRYWASVVMDPVYDPAGQLAGFATITRDVTEQKKMQQDLLESERRFRILVQGVTDYAIYMLSPAGTVTNWNSGAQRIKQYGADDIIGQHFSVFYTPEDRAKGMPERTLSTALRDGRFEAEGWRVRRDGTRFWAHVIVDAIRDEQGELIGFAKITRDITEKRQAQEALEQTREALFQAQKTEAIGQLTGGIAHDFNNLLSVLSSGLDVLNSMSQGHDRRVLESMRRAIDRGATLTQQLLAFARQQPLAPSLHDLNTLISNFEPVLKRATRSPIKLDLQLGPHVPCVLVDEPRFEAAVLNLVVNARDALPEGGRIVISTALVDVPDGEHPPLKPGRYVRVCVQDNGTGMSAETRQRAFEPFFTTKPVGKGTGLGLSQVQGFIAQSGGNVEVESELGQGTTVCLYLPAVDGEPVSNAVRSDAEKVLIVEDEPDLMEVAAELFRTMGYEVLTAANGQDALAVLERNPTVDVLFSDVIMPGMSGVELARTARKLYPNTRTVLASGYPLPALRASQADIDEFTIVTKPYRMSEIIKRLR